MKKKLQSPEFKLVISCFPDWCPGRRGHRGFTFHKAIFDKVIQLLLHSKVIKAELYLIGGYHNKWLELTYYSRVRNERTGGNKHTGGIFSSK